MTKKVKQLRIKRWIKELLNKENKKCVGQLCNGAGAYCAIGLAYYKVLPTCVKHFDSGYIHVDVRNYFGVSFQESINIVDMNDIRKYSFSKIAKYLEKTYCAD